jgi:hypothetical protein
VKVLGVDCGDVIFYTWGRMVPGSLDGLRSLARSGDFKNIYIVSKANPVTRVIFLIRLRAIGFWNYTGIPRENLFFVRRPEDKAGVCKRLGVTHFIDDRLEVLFYLKNVPHRYALAPRRPHELTRYPGTREEVTVVRSWSELVPKIISQTAPAVLRAGPLRGK